VGFRALGSDDLTILPAGCSGMAGTYCGSNRAVVLGKAIARSNYESGP
jgi:hypothetical protein